MSKKQNKSKSKNNASKKIRMKAKATGTPAAAKAGKPTKERAATASSSGVMSVDGTATPREPDPRLPPIGTVIEKRDRHGTVRCKCTVVEGGIRYDGKMYRSLSAAAMAAAIDLGLTNKTQNGFTFWGLSKPPRPPADPLEALDRAWQRFHGTASAVVKDGVTDQNRTKVAAILHKQAQTMTGLHGQVA